MCDWPGGPSSLANYQFDPEAYRRKQERSRQKLKDTLDRMDRVMEEHKLDKA